MTEYIAFVFEENGKFGAAFPDFPGCITAGDSREELAAMASEALLAHIALLHEYREDIAPPSPLPRIVEEFNTSGATGMLVVGVSNTKPAVRQVNILVPEAELKRIDAQAKKTGLSRSAFLVQAALKEIRA